LTACLIAAALWAIGIALFRPLIARFGPGPTNLFKCSLAAVVYLLWLAATGRVSGLAALDPRDLASLALSGLVGLAIGDWLLFAAVRIGGVQRTLVVYNSAPILTALLGWGRGDPVPSPPAWIGMLLVVAGVSLVETDPARPRGSTVPSDRRTLRLTILAAFGAALGQAAGLVVMQPALQRVPLVEASFARLVAAALGLLALVLISPAARAGLARMTPRSWPALTLPSVIGTVIAVLFMMQGVRDLPPGIAAALLNTTPLFALPISRFVLREPVGLRSVAGTLLAVAGVALFAV